LLSVADIDFTRLTPEAQATLVIAREMADEGLPLEEAATRHHLDRKQLTRQLDQLGREMRSLAAGHRLDLMTEDEYAALRDSIRIHGQLVPALVDGNGQLIDGHHRLRAMKEVYGDRWSELWRTRQATAEVLAADERERLALVVNLARRQVTAAARRLVCEHELKRDPGRSDRSIATSIGCSPSTVGSVRAGLEAGGRVSKLDTHRDSTGRDQPARKPVTPQPKPELVTIPLNLARRIRLAIGGHSDLVDELLACPGWHE
jgi:ParB-like chromosome segregation protein Spo0J